MKFLKENVPVFIVTNNDTKEYWFLNHDYHAIGDITKHWSETTNRKFILDKQEIREKCSWPIDECFEYQLYNRLIKNSIEKLDGFRCLNKKEELIVF